MLAMKMAIYDLDKTLVRHATFTPFLVYAARRLSLWRLLLLPVWVLMMLGYRARFYDRTALKTAGMKLMLGRHSVHRLEEMGEGFAEHHLKKSGWIKPIVDLMEEDRARGAQILVATAAFQFYAKAFARRLSIEKVIGTRWDGEGIPGGNCYGETKRARVAEFLGEDFPLAAVRFVSDSFADAPLLNEVGEPVFVTSSRRKRARAEALGWSVIDPDI